MNKMDNYPISLEGKFEELAAMKQILQNSQYSPVII
jgi:hypothetical protein